MAEVSFSIQMDENLKEQFEQVYQRTSWRTRIDNMKD